jgi:hypothetical protein
VTVFDADVPTAIRRAGLGLHEAMARFSVGIGAGDVDRAYIAYVEAIIWVRAFDEMNLRFDPTYRVARDEDPKGQVVAALAWARDKSLHQLVALHEPAVQPIDRSEAGPCYPDGRYAVWLRSSDVTLRDTSVFRGDLDKAKAYDARLGGRSIWVTLADARWFLWWCPIPGKTVALANSMPADFI